jgi:CheY-like chemotaxis protein
MPLVDGYISTRMIREHERKTDTVLPLEARSIGRTPIFAVSASLRAEDLEKFVEIGFDGWLLKPIDFQRLNLTLAGAFSSGKRQEGIYERSRFRLGGWFATPAYTK